MDRRAFCHLVKIMSGPFSTLWHEIQTIEFIVENFSKWFFFVNISNSRVQYIISPLGASIWSTPQLVPSITIGATFNTGTEDYIIYVPRLSWCLLEFALAGLRMPFHDGFQRSPYLASFLRPWHIPRLQYEIRTEFVTRRTRARKAWVSLPHSGGVLRLRVNFSFYERYINHPLKSLPGDLLI